MSYKISRVVDSTKHYVEQYKMKLTQSLNSKTKRITAAILAGSLAFVGYKLYPFNPFSNSSSAATSPAFSRGADNEITVTVLGNDCPPAPARQAQISPMEALLTFEQNYVNRLSWKDIVQRYAGVPGGVVVSLRDYQGNDKKQACKLALGRLVETTIGSMASREHPKYKELTDLIIKKGLDDCKKNIDLRYREVRFGL